MQAMISSCYSPAILWFFLGALSLLSSSSFAREQSSLYSALFDTDKPAESHNNELWPSDDDQYADEFKTRRASDQHEQALLTDIYDPSRTYISMHDDRVHPTNFTYFTFNSPGTYRFILISLQGDADLYISTRDKYVSYENYEFSSCTCGIDEILIESYMKRPVYIGIYGYSQYRVSQYRLLIELVDSRTSLEDTHDHEDTSNAEKTKPVTRDDTTTQQERKGSRVPANVEKDSRHLVWDILVWLLNFLLEVLG